MKRKIEKKNDIPLSSLPYQDCNLCQHSTIGKFDLIYCDRPYFKPTIPAPNCNARKVPCVYFEKN